MSRSRRGAGTVEIIHSSFIDLLFGAFGAFVFLMIVYVIYTMQLTPEKVKDIIDKVTQQNQQLQEELKDYKNIKERYHQLEQKLQDTEKEKTDLEGKYSKSQKEIHDLQSLIIELKDENNSISKELTKFKDAQKNILVIMDENNTLKTKIDELNTIIITIKGELKEARGRLAILEKKKTEKKNHLKEWFKYLFFAVLFILGSELSAALTSLEINRGHQILAEDGAELAFVAEKNIWEIRGGNSETLDKRQKNRQFFAGLRTILWVSILIASYIFSIKMLHIDISILWMIGISALLYIYLRFRFNLLP